MKTGTKEHFVCLCLLRVQAPCPMVYFREYPFIRL
jgi:hypothetical protein